MRTIDADALQEEYKKHHDGKRSLLIDVAPTVEPHRMCGRWIPKQVSSGRDSWQCSVCGRRARGKLKNLPFCHCGADMREAE